MVGGSWIRLDQGLRNGTHNQKGGFGAMGMQVVPLFPSVYYAKVMLPALPEPSVVPDYWSQGYLVPKSVAERGLKELGSCIPFAATYGLETYRI